MATTAQQRQQQQQQQQQQAWREQEQLESGQGEEDGEEMSDELGATGAGPAGPAELSQWLGNYSAVEERENEHDGDGEEHTQWNIADDHDQSSAAEVAAAYLRLLLGAEAAAAAAAPPSNEPGQDRANPSSSAAVPLPAQPQQPQQRQPRQQQHGHQQQRQQQRGQQQQHGQEEGGEEQHGQEQNGQPQRQQEREAAWATLFDGMPIRNVRPGVAGVGEGASSSRPQTPVGQATAPRGSRAARANDAAAPAGRAEEQARAARPEEPAVIEVDLQEYESELAREVMRTGRAVVHGQDIYRFDFGSQEFVSLRPKRKSRRTVEPTPAEEVARQVAAGQKRYWVRFDNRVMLKTHLELINISLKSCAHSSVALLNVNSHFIGEAEAMERLTRCSSVLADPSFSPCLSCEGAAGAGAGGAGGLCDARVEDVGLVDARVDEVRRKRPREAAGLGSPSGKAALFSAASAASAASRDVMRDVPAPPAGEDSFGYWAHVFDVDDIDEVWRAACSAHVFGQRQLGDVFEIASCRAAAAGTSSSTSSSSFSSALAAQQAATGPAEPFDLLGVTPRVRRQCSVSIIVPGGRDEAAMSVAGAALVKALQLREPVYYRHRTAAEDKDVAGDCICPSAHSAPRGRQQQAKLGADKSKTPKVVSWSSAAAAAAFGTCLMPDTITAPTYGQQTDCHGKQPRCVAKSACFFRVMSKDEHVLASQYKLGLPRPDLAEPPHGEPPHVARVPRQQSWESFRLRPPNHHHQDSPYQLYRLQGVLWKPVP